MPQKRKVSYTSSVQCACPVKESSSNSVTANEVKFVRFGQATTTVLSKANKARLAKLAADKQERLAKLAADKQARLAEQAAQLRVTEEAGLAKEASVRALQDELVAAMQFIEQGEQAKKAAIASFFELVESESGAAAWVAAEQVAESYLQFQALCMGCE